MTTQARAVGTMAGKRRWTEAEDEVVRSAAVLNRHDDKGIGGRGSSGRLRAVAALGRSDGAIRSRAVRIGASSYPPAASGIEPLGAARAGASPPPSGGVRNALPRRLHSARAAPGRGLARRAPFRALPPRMGSDGQGD